MLWTALAFDSLGMQDADATRQDFLALQGQYAKMCSETARPKRPLSTSAHLPVQSSVLSTEWARSNQYAQNSQLCGPAANAGSFLPSAAFAHERAGTTKYAQDVELCGRAAEMRSLGRSAEVSEREGLHQNTKNADKAETRHDDAQRLVIRSSNDSARGSLPSRQDGRTFAGIERGEMMSSMQWNESPTKREKMLVMYLEQAHEDIDSLTDTLAR